jgi:branched-chain amino acid transport system substrate-binding protein
MAGKMPVAAPIGRRGILAGAAALAAATGLPRRARAADPVRIGVINDMSGPYAGVSGPGAVVGARMAIADYGGSVLGRPVELLSADHQNKADIGLAIIREWFGPGKVGMVADFANTSVALGTQPLLTQFNKIAMYTGVGTSILTGEACSPLSVHWAHDSYAATRPMIAAMVAQGLDSFYFLVADYTFGDVLANDCTKAIAASGGKLLGTSRHPLGTSDFASFLLSARTSGAKVIVLCNAGTDSTNSYKQAVEFGIAPAQTFITPLMFMSDVHALGLPAAQGLQFTTSWYWDQTDETRAFAKRFYDQTKYMPNDTHAAIYSAIGAYLKAIALAGTDEAQAVMKAIHATPVNDVFARNGEVRADGKMVFDRYLVRAKAPAESRGGWDELAVVRTIPAAQGFRPLSDNACPFLKS